MADDRDDKKDKAKEAPGEATVVGGMAPPPVAPPPAAPPQAPKNPAAAPGKQAGKPAGAPARPSAPNPDATQVGGMAPPPAVPPAAPKAPSAPNPDATQIGGIAPPPAMPGGPAPGAAPAPGKPLTVVPGTSPADDAGDSDRTVIAGTADATVVGGMGSGDATVVAGIDSATVVGGAMPLATPATLVRLSPSEHKGEVVSLDPGRSEYAVGRHEASDIVLYTPSAGRQHARINRGHDGRWYVRPAEGKEVRLGRRTSTDEVALTNGLKITLGDDQFQVKTEPDEAGSGGGLGSIDATKAILFGVIGLLVIAIIAVLILR